MVRHQNLPGSSMLQTHHIAHGADASLLHAGLIRSCLRFDNRWKLRKGKDLEMGMRDRGPGFPLMVDEDRDVSHSLQAEQLPRLVLQPRQNVHPLVKLHPTETLLMFWRRNHHVMIPVAGLAVPRRFAETLSGRLAKRGVRIQEHS